MMYLEKNSHFFAFILKLALFNAYKTKCMQIVCNTNLKIHLKNTYY